jgi:ferredoxin
MSYRVNPELAAEIAAFGGKTVDKCFNCGNCTAVCALSQGDTVFPRKTIRYLQIGLDERLMESPEPWLCYYCGTCSDTCPREAHPGELMMAARRWLTSRYDWTGLSKRLYLSQRWEFGLLFSVALLVLALFIVPGVFGVAFGFQAVQGAALEHVRLDLFANKEWIHYGDWTLAAMLTLLLSINAFRMIFFVRRGNGGSRIPLAVWLTQLPKLFIHAASQKRWLDCDNDTRFRWLQHLLLVTGYGTMFLLVVIFLPWFQRDGAELHWTAIPGYYGTLMLMGATLLAIRGRFRRKEAIHRFSQHSDWMFLALLLLTTLSGIMLHVARLLDLPWPTYVLYVAHLMIAVPMLVIEVPFGKWLHLVFRPVASYMAAVRDAAVARETRREKIEEPGVAPATA